jgi:outer membrane protein assembly factor BamE (lipoprotein component of BamABCDE complex)
MIVRLSVFPLTERRFLGRGGVLCFLKGGVNIMMRMMVFALLSILVIGCFGSCITTTITSAREDKDKVADWNGVIEQNKNRMTYDEALTKFGPPTSVKEGDRIFIVTWVKNRQSAISIPTNRGTITIPRDNGSSELSLTFDKETRIMTNGTYREW